ncbi:MAG: TetR/AcrR family transcriptional regulator [Bacteroidales bacterium]|nr:TetR/AcrR family transcriptional regulator [Bacteroidales bacterium]
MSEFSNNLKYQDILSAGKMLYWKYGIKRVTVEEICKEAKVSKVTYYKFFKNKIELAKIIFDSVVGQALKDYKIIIDSNLAFVEKVNKIMKMKHEGAKDISQEFMLDLYKNPDLGMIPYMEELKEKSLKITIEFLKDSQQKGNIRKEIKIDFVLYYFNQMMQMVLDEELLSKYEHPKDLIMEVTSFFFYGIGAKNN